LKKFLIVLLFSVFSVSNSFSADLNTQSLKEKITNSPEEKDWELLSQDENIKVYKKDIPGSPIVAFRGEATIDAPIAKVASVLVDTSRKLEWIADALEAKNIKSISPLERVEYNKTHTPWPVKDRDFLFQGKLLVDSTKKQVEVVFKSIKDDSLMPETSAVRGEILHGKERLTSLSENKTWIEVEIAVDPKGAIPKWVANLVQKSWPRKTIEGIRKQVTKPDVKAHPGIEALLSGKTLEEALKISGNTESL